MLVYGFQNLPHTLGAISTQGSHFTREKPLFPRTVGKTREKVFFPGFTQAKPGIFSRFFPGKTQVFFPGKTQS